MILNLMSACKNTSEITINDNICLNLTLVTPLKNPKDKGNEFDKLSRRTKEQILNNNNIYCRICPDYNKICKK